MSTRDASPTLRSLADDLRTRGDEQIAALLKARPDLLHPVPADLRALAVRAAAAPSVLRALDRLDAFELGVAEAIAAAEGPTSFADVAHRVRAIGEADPPLEQSLLDLADARVAPTLDELWTLGLLWGGRPEALHLVRAAREVLVGGTGMGDDESSNDERAREHLRQPSPPDVLDAPVREQLLINRAAAQAALDVLRLVGELLDEWSTAPPPVLRAGGLGVRDLARVAERLDVDPDTAAFITELAFVAGLTLDDGAAEAAYAPTAAYDTWLEADPAVQWVELTAAWLTTSRVAGLVGSRDAKESRLAALGPDLERSMAPAVRAAVLEEISLLDEGVAPTERDVMARLAWRRPRRSNALRDALVSWTLREASILGITGMGAMTPHGRALLAGPHDPELRAAAAVALTQALPDPVDHVILQPDMTAVAPGPLRPDLAREFALIADVESTGGATVYRFSDRSVRRAFDAGRDAGSLKAFLADRSRTPVPQPLDYLIDDVARRHGSLRVGAASSYIRCDDEGVVTAVMAERTAQTLQLRRLAPTVLVSPVAATVVLERLQEAGYAPAAEGGDGVVVLRRPQSHRSDRAARNSPTTLETVPSDRLLHAAVRALRAGENGERTTGAAWEAAAGQERPLPERTTPSRTLSLVRSAIEDGAALRIGYAGSDGTTIERLLDPVKVAGGQLTAYDHRGGDVRTFAVSRIVGVEILADLVTGVDTTAEENA